MSIEAIRDKSDVSSPRGTSSYQRYGTTSDPNQDVQAGTDPMMQLVKMLQMVIQLLSILGPLLKQLEQLGMGGCGGATPDAAGAGGKLSQPPGGPLGDGGGADDPGQSPSKHHSPHAGHSPHGPVHQPSHGHKPPSDHRPPSPPPQEPPPPPGAGPSPAPGVPAPGVPAPGVPAPGPVQPGQGGTPGDFSGFSDKAQVGPLSEADGKKMADQVANQLMTDFGFSKEQAAGIAGNLYHESAGMNANVNEFGSDPSSPTYGDPNKTQFGYGWAQWTGTRKQDYLNFCQENSVEPGSPRGNMMFLEHEMRNSESASQGAVKGASTPEEAATAFRASFERATNPVDPSRQAAARSIYDSMG